MLQYIYMYTWLNHSDGTFDTWQLQLWTRRIDILNLMNTHTIFYIYIYSLIAFGVRRESAQNENHRIQITFSLTGSILFVYVTLNSERASFNKFYLKRAKKTHKKKLLLCPSDNIFIKPIECLLRSFTNQWKRVRSGQIQYHEIDPK